MRQLVHPFRPPQRGRNRLFSLALFATPLLLIVPVLFLVLSHRFDGLYGQDSYAYYQYATGPLREALLALRPPPPFFWPPGYPLFVSLLSLALGTGTAAAQVASLVAGAAVPVLTALLARELWPAGSRPGTNSTLPLLAGLFAALAGQLWQSSAVVMSDTTGLAAATLGAWALARFAQGRGGRWLLLAAGATAYAVLTRWAYALVALPLAAAAFLSLARQPRRQAASHALSAAVVVLAVLSPVIGALLQGTAAPGAGTGAFVGDLEVVPWHPLNALRNEFVNADGLLRYRLPNGLYYAVAPAHRFFFTPALVLLLLPGLRVLWQQRTPLRSLLLVAWPGIIYLFLGGAPWQNFRFVLPYLPPLAILAALGVTTVAGWLSTRTRPLLWLFLAGGYLWMAYGGWTLTTSFIERKDADLETVRWVEERIPAEAQLLTFSISLTIEQYSDLAVHDLYFQTPHDLAALMEQGQPVYLLLDLENIRGQWAGRAPATNYAWLQQNAGLEKVGEQRQATLFRVGARTGTAAP